jgi:phosphoglycerate kinase
VLGFYIGHEFRQVASILNAQLVVFSGLKIDKLDYLEGIVRRGEVRVIIVGGSLSMSFLRARGRIIGQEFSLGRASMPENRDAEWYIPEDRVNQAERILRQAEASGVRFVLPTDFVLDDGTVTDQIPANQQQMDVGPRTIELFQREVERFIAEMVTRPVPSTAFYNGVLGKFEDPRFEQGTKAFVQFIKRMTDAGVKTYVGGGEGRLAMLKYGQEEWATYIFTAGGTVLRSMGGDIVPYLKALLLHTIDQAEQEAC